MFVDQAAPPTTNTFSIVSPHDSNTFKLTTKIPSASKSVAPPEAEKIPESQNQTTSERASLEAQTSLSKTALFEKIFGNTQAKTGTTKIVVHGGLTIGPKANCSSTSTQGKLRTSDSQATTSSRRARNLSAPTFKPDWSKQLMQRVY